MKFKFFKFAKNFGFWLATKYVFNMLLYKITKKPRFLHNRFKLIKKYLLKNYSNVIDFENNSKNSINKDSKVWVFWAQGEKNAPEIVKKCIESIKKHFKTNEVIILDNTNYLNYAKIPEYITQKVQNKTISLTHFSDILRATLLTEHGGIWLDATCYLTNPIFQDLNGKEFYSGKLAESHESLKYVSSCKWCAYFLAAGKDNIIVRNLRNILFEYWKTNTSLIEYFLIDYIISLIYENCEEAKSIIDAVPENNQEIYALGDVLFKPYDDKIFEDITYQTKLFKLSYKFDEENTKEENTFYKKIIEGSQSRKK